MRGGRLTPAQVAAVFPGELLREVISARQNLARAL